MEHEINYLAAIGYALIGWVGQCIYYYFQFDTEEPFDRMKFWRKYDKYIISGFAFSIMLALLGDFGWTSVVKHISMELAYDERVNIIFGLFSVLIVIYISNKAKKKLE